MAPSTSAETANSASETPSTDAGIRTPEIISSASARIALTATERAPPAKMAARRSASAAPQVIRQVSREHAGDRHVEDIGAERQNAAILEDQRLDGQDGGHHHARGCRSQRAGQQRAAHQVSAGADADRKVDHLGGEDEGAHHAQQGHFGIVEPALRHANDVADGRRRSRVERGPHGRR